MKKNQQGFSFLVILLALISLVLILAVSWFVYTKNNKNNSSSEQTSSSQPTPNSVETAADAYIISKVGNENFKKFYTFDKDKSSYADTKDSKYDFMAYHFSPVKAITDYNDVIMVQVNRDNLQEVFADTVPDCIKNKSFCEFSINREKSLEIANKNSLSTSDLNVSWQNSNSEYAKGLAFVIVVSSCSQNKSLFIDYRDGKVLGTEAGCGALD